MPRWCGEVFREGQVKGFGAFILSLNEKQAVSDYIANQVEHHRTVSFMEEYRQLLEGAGVKYDEHYL